MRISWFVGLLGFLGVLGYFRQEPLLYIFFLFFLNFLEPSAEQFINHLCPPFRFNIGEDHKRK